MGEDLTAGWVTWVGLGYSSRGGTWRVSGEWEEPLLKGADSEAGSPDEA